MDAYAEYVMTPEASDPLVRPPLPFGWADWPRDLDEATFLNFLRTRPDDEKWELWDGEPRLKDGAPRAVNPASSWHQSVVQRLSHRLQMHFDDRDMPFDAIPEMGVRIAKEGEEDTLLVPDLTVVDADVGRTIWAERFVLAAEVLSPSNTYGEIDHKLERYSSHPSCLYTLLLEQDEPRLTLRARSDGWRERTIVGADATLELSAFEFAVPLSYVYARVIGR